MTADLLEPRTTEVPRPSRLPARSGAALVFWLLVGLHLVPVWAFHYVPTQDGPTHLFSSLILKDHGLACTRYDQFFVVRSDPLPNWVAHLLLAGLMYVFPPLVAEKVLVSFYILGFAWAARYFLTSLGGAGNLLAAAGLLFVFNRCFWLGFYNFCLGMVLYWAVLGYVVRRQERLGWREGLLLVPVLLLAYFIHLFVFLLTAGSAAWIAMTARSGRWRRLGWVLAAALPAGALTLHFLAGTGFFGSPGATRLGGEPLAWLRGESSLERLGLELLSIQWQLFYPQAGGVPLGVFVWLFFALVALVALGIKGTPRDAERTHRRVWPVAVLGVMFFLLYILLPDHLGADPHSTEHGGFLKARLALFPALLALACFPEPRLPGARRLLQGTLFFLVGLNLFLVTVYFRQANQELKEYTAGVEAAGRGHTLFVLAPDQECRPIADPLYHASSYYCLGTGNVNLENYQAATNHFTLLFRPGVVRGYGKFAEYPDPDRVDVILAWDTSLAAGVPLPYQEVFQQGRMRIFRKD
jgi:hypothetical protein